jgi:hypothetical protein
MKKTLYILVLLIVLFSVIVSLAGLFLNDKGSLTEFQSVHGETVTLDGIGLYKFDSVSTAAQGRASDFITLFVAVPLLIASLILTQKGSLRGALMLAGTLGYFLYTYTSYTFLWMYNPLFIVYVALMSMSFFAFVLCFMGIRSDKISTAFKKTLPVKFLGWFQLFIGFMIGMLWIGKIAPTITGQEIPQGLEHYTTLVIQGMDLGFVVPAAFLSGILLIKRRPLGYLLSSILIFKGVTMLTAISAMIINMIISGVKVSVIEMVLFPAFNLLAIVCLIILLKNVDTNMIQKAGHAVTWS